MKLCECGCGQAAPIARGTHRKYGWLKGQPLRFLIGHRGRLGRHSRNASLATGRRLTRTGYVDVIGVVGRGRHRLEHTLIVERVLGRKLPAGAVIHHVDGNRTNNANSNLVVLASQSEHTELHRRLRVLRAGGNPHTDRLCCSCRQPKPICEFYLCHSKDRGLRYGGECKECAREGARERQRLLRMAS